MSVFLNKLDAQISIQSGEDRLKESFDAQEGSSENSPNQTNRNLVLKNL